MNKEINELNVLWYFQSIRNVEGLWIRAADLSSQTHNIHLQASRRPSVSNPLSSE